MQFITILKKECRQHLQLVLAMLLFCFLLQLGSFTSALFGSHSLSYAAIALFITTMYAGSAAAFSFSIEHEEKTFGFLRNLPVSPLTVILGKVLWVILGTVLVLTGSLTFALIFEFFFWIPRSSVSEYPDVWFWVAYIIEVIVWGFFWSPLFRNQIYAVIATFASNILMFYMICLSYTLQSTNIFNDNVQDAILIQLKITTIVGIAAVCLMLQWFKRTIWKNVPSRFLSYEKFVFYHSYLPTTPFTTLLYQSVWQSLILLLIGIVVAIIVCVNIVLSLIFSAENVRIILCFGGLFFVMMSGGCTFGADQRNQSFRFLSRCGISAGKIWWSRVLPFAIVFLPIMITAIIVEFVCFFLKVKYGILNISDFIFIISATITLWMIPFSVGTFLSIYCRSMIVSCALTVSASILFVLLMSLGWFLCRFNPLWTILPLTVALLVASRLRATDWLRERQSWKSLLKPLFTFFITVIIILFAIPFVRIYTVPYTSLNEVETLLDQIPLADRLNPEERRKLFQETAEKLTQKVTEKDLERIINWNIIARPTYYDGHQEMNNYSYTGEELKKHLKNKCITLKETIKSIPLFETWLLYDYEIKMRIINDEEYIHLLNPGDNTKKNIITRCRYLPWEKARILRRFNWELRSQLYTICTDKFVCPSGFAEKYPFNHEKEQKRIQKEAAKESFRIAIFDQLPSDWYVQDNYFHIANLLRSGLVHNALHLWYLEHDYTLPESLDELVGSSLDEIPHDPLTGAIMEYSVYPQQDKSPNIQTPQPNNNTNTDQPDKTDQCLLKLGAMTFEIQFQKNQSKITILWGK